MIYSQILWSWVTNEWNYRSLIFPKKLLLKKLGQSWSIDFPQICPKFANRSIFHIFNLQVPIGQNFDRTVFKYCEVERRSNFRIFSKTNFSVQLPRCRKIYAWSKISLRRNGKNLKFSIWESKKTVKLNRRIGNIYLFQ